MFYKNAVKSTTMTCTKQHTFSYMSVFNCEGTLLLDADAVG